MAVWESWLKRARSFTEYAEADLKNGRYDSCAFFAQQAVEMLLRGVLLKRTGVRPITTLCLRWLTSSPKPCKEKRPNKLLDARSSSRNII